ncbi:MAG: ion channel, partial [Ignavibacteria bacterium]|nr:ion channel [Ignavibacteria bacterium]
IIFALSLSIEYLNFDLKILAFVMKVINYLLKLNASPRLRLKFNYSLSTLLVFHLFIVPFLPFRQHELVFTLLTTLIYFNLLFVINVYRQHLLGYVFVFLIMEWVFFMLKMRVLSNISSVANIFLFLIIIYVFMSNLARAKKVDSTIMIQAINGYLLLGVISGIGVSLMMQANDASFNFPSNLTDADKFYRLCEYQYYGLVSMTTLGYGEITPQTPQARSLATLITIVGQLYLAFIVAMLVGKYSSQKAE